MSTTFDVPGKLIPPASCLQYQILIKIKKSTKFNNMHHKFPGSLICSFKSRACDKEVNAITNFQNYELSRNNTKRINFSKNLITMMERRSSDVAQRNFGNNQVQIKYE